MEVLDQWLSGITTWLKEAIEWCWDAYFNFMKALFFIWLTYSLEAIAWVFAHIPVPDFLSQYSLAALLSAAGPTVGWIISEFRIPEGMAIIAAGYTFRVIRKFSTAFQW